MQNEKATFSEVGIISITTYTKVGKTSTKNKVNHKDQTGQHNQHSTARETPGNKKMPLKNTLQHQKGLPENTPQHQRTLSQSQGSLGITPKRSKGEEKRHTDNAPQTKTIKASLNQREGQHEVRNMQQNQLDWLPKD